MILLSKVIPVFGLILIWAVAPIARLGLCPAKLANEYIEDALEAS